MPSAVATGSYYQRRTKLFLQNLGWHVEPLQLYGWIKTAKGWRPVKRDAFGADLLAVCEEGVLFVQVKGGATWRSGLAAARKAFAKYPLGPGCEQIIIGWPPRARRPERIVVAVGPCAADHPVIVPARKKPHRSKLPLFARSA